MLGLSLHCHITRNRGYLPIAPERYSSVFQYSRSERNITFCEHFFIEILLYVSKRVTKNPSGYVFVKNYDLRIP